MNKFMTWYHTYYQQISWFLIGFLLHDGLTNLGAGHYSDAAISLGLAALNYYFARKP